MGVIVPVGKRNGVGILGFSGFRAVVGFTNRNIKNAPIPSVAINTSTLSRSQIFN